MRPSSNLRPRSAVWTLLAWALIALIFTSGALGLYYCNFLEVPPEKEADIRPQLDELASLSYGCLAVSAVCAGLWVLVRRWRKGSVPRKCNGSAP